MKKQHWFLRWLFVTVLIVLFASCVNPLIQENMPKEPETKAPEAGETEPAEQEQSAPKRTARKRT